MKLAKERMGISRVRENARGDVTQWLSVSLLILSPGISRRERTARGLCPLKYFLSQWLPGMVIALIGVDAGQVITC
jgi:hypothetical protein